MKRTPPPMDWLQQQTLNPIPHPLKSYHVDANAAVWIGVVYGTHKENEALTLFRAKGSEEYEYLPNDAVFPNINAANAAAAQLADQLEEAVMEGGDE